LKKILLIRFSSIGDIVLSTPVVKALKEQLNCELHVLTKKQYQDIFKNNPHVDHVHPFEKNINETISQLKVENFDFVVDLQKSLRSIKIIKKLKKPNSSFSKLNIQKWLMVNFKINKLPDVHIVDRYFEAVKELGVTNKQNGLEYYFSDNDVIDPLSINKNLKDGFIAFVIGGQHFTKIMPAEKVASIVSKLNLPVLLLGGPEDKNRGEEITELSKNNEVINTCGQFSLNASASLVKQSKLVITNDTGLMHIAAAFKKPIISLWGNTIPEFGMYPYLPLNKDRFVIAEVENLSCRPCSKIGHKKCPKNHFKCMLNQDEDFIVKSAIKLLKSN
jgi:ADP-heptose:LPS heptosyltransferase